MHELNTDDLLHKTSMGILEALEQDTTADDEDLRFARAMRAEFEQSGAHLEVSHRQKLRGLQARAAKLSADFCAGAARPSSENGGVWVMADALRDWSLLPRLRRSNLRVFVPTEPTLLTEALRHCGCASTRHELFLCREKLGAENLPVLESLLNVRAELASIAGFESYANYVAATNGRLENNPSSTLNLLRVASSRLRPIADAESQHLARTSTGLHSWDVDWAIAQAQTCTNLDVGAHGIAHTYFELTGVLSGLDTVLRDAFGLTLRNAAPHDGELWHSTVTKLQLFKMNDVHWGQPIGILYLDLFPRPHKTSAPALYTLRTTTEHMGAECSAAGVSLEAKKELTLPAVALVCNLPTPGGLGCDEKTGASMLVHSQLRTLYHEMGHAIHALVARTRYQHFSGVRVAQDFVEVPSLLFERFADDPRVLCHWAFARTDGADKLKLPYDVAKTICDSSKAGDALRTQEQLISSMLDLELHMNPSFASPRRSSALLASLCSEYSSMPAVPDSHSHALFSHLAGYGASYYSYLWGRAIASQVWRQGFQGNPMQGSAGRLWCDSVLRYGGARDPRELLRNFLMQVETDATGRSRMGDIPSSQVDEAISGLVNLK